jgi:energy-coupling factor transporter ATP-binding protein EcfA2
MWRSGAPPGWLELSGVTFRNLKGFDLRLPLGRLIMVAGPSGAGKSTLFRDVLHPAVGRAIKAGKARLTGRDFVRATGFAAEDLRAGEAKPVPPFAELRHAHGFKAVIEVDQAPIGKTPRSTPATYLGIFDLIRQFFASLPEAKMRGYTASRFSFNTKGGRCESCQGAGRIKLEMAFMPDTYLPCDECRGLRYGPSWPTSPGNPAPSARCCSSPSRRPRRSSISIRSSPPCAASWWIAASATSRSARVRRPSPAARRSASSSSPSSPAACPPTPSAPAASPAAISTCSRSRPSGCT